MNTAIKLSTIFIITTHMIHPSLIIQREKNFGEASVGETNNKELFIKDILSDYYIFQKNDNNSPETEMIIKAIELERTNLVPRSLTNTLIVSYFNTYLYPPHEKHIQNFSYITTLYWKRKLYNQNHN